jgi:hypothetical protein
MRFRATLWLLLGLLLPGAGVAAPDGKPTEYQLKAAIIFNFTKFIFWPPDSFPSTNAPFRIGVFEGSAITPELELAMRDKTVRNRHFVVEECRTLADARRCHVLFVSGSEKRRIREIISTVSDGAVLTIGEDDGFIDNGGIINFFRQGNKFRFQISNDAAKRAGLRIDSKLLELGAKPG